MNAHFGTWLNDKRGRRGEPGFVSQRELAQRMGVDATYISQLEAKASPPSYGTRQRIHAALGTTEEELIALGIVRARSARPEPLHALPDDPLAALIATFTPRQREMLLDILDRANVRALEDDAEEDRRPDRAAES